MAALNPSFVLLLACAGLLALPREARAQTWYWNASVAGNEVQKTWNWTSLPNGGGVRPPAGRDDSFNDTAFGLWKAIDSVPKGTGQPATAIAMTGTKLSITAAGADVWVNENQFAGVYQNAVTGAFDVTVKIDERTIADPWSKAGIMVWNDFTNFGKGGGFAVELTGQSGFVVHVDSVDHIWDGGTGTTAPGRFDFPTGPTQAEHPATVPCWLRAVKRKVGTDWVFTGYYKTHLDSPWVKIRGDYRSQRTSDTAQVGLFVTSHNINQASTVIFDDFQGAGDLPSDAYDLNFGGTGATADVNAVLGANVSAGSVNFTGYQGSFSFGGWALSASGDVNFGSTLSIVPGTGRLELKGASAQVLTPRANDTLPRIVKTGAGTVSVAGQPLLADSLSLAGGTFDLGGNSAHLLGLSGTGGTLTGLAAGDTLFVHGNADFSGLAATSFAGGVVAVKSAGDGRIAAFNPGGKPFPGVTLWTHATGAGDAILKVGPGALDVRGNLVFRGQRAASGWDGIIDFNDSNPDVTVADSVLQVLDAGAATGNSHPIFMGSGRWRVGGSVAFSLRGGGNDGSTLELNGPAGRVQRLAVTDHPLGAVAHASASTVRLGATLSAASLSHTGGILDLNNRSVRLTGNLAVTGGANAVSGLGRDTVAVGGNANFKGLASGKLVLSSLDRWVIDVEGTLTADSAEIGNSDARPGTTGQATAASVDLGLNLNWSFGGGLPTAPAAVSREPRDTTVILGQKATFAAAASGHGPFSWKWLRRGDTAAVSDDSLLVIDSAAFADSGWYRVVVSNSSGTDTSAEARLRVLPQPVGVVVLRDPADVSVRTGGRAVFTVGVSGTRPIAFAWRRRGDDARVLSTDSVLTLDQVADSLNGTSYYVVVSNLDTAAKDTSGEARLTVRTCDSLTVQVSADTTVEEGRPASVSGRAGCADGFAWTVLSGPAPRINDPGVDTLRIAAPRVVGDTVIRYQFSAWQGGTTLEKVVQVKVKEAIPDPKFTLAPKAAWDGLKPFSVRPAVSNRADLEKFPAWPLRYAWTVEPLFSDSALAADSLTLADPVEDGEVAVTLCLDNGGARSCDTTVVTVKRTPVGLRADFRLPGGLVWRDGALRFGQAGRVRLYDTRGRLLLDARAGAGETRVLPPEALKALRALRARLLFTP